MTDKVYIFKKIKETILTFDPGADIVLYGSQASGAASPESDWDFLILTEYELEYQIKKEIRKAVHLIELETDEIISIIIHSKKYWNRSQNSVTPFYKNVSGQSMTI